MDQNTQSGAAAVPAEVVARVLDVTQPAAFEEMLRGLMHNDNNVRSSAESVLEACTQHAEPLAQQLVQLLRGSKDTAVRSISAVLLRKNFASASLDDSEGLWAKLSPTFQEGVKAELFVAVKAETDLDITRKICDTVGELGGPMLVDEKWPQLLPFLFECMQSGEDRLIEGALMIFAQLVTVCVTPLLSHLGAMHQMLQQLLGGTQANMTTSVKVAAIRSVVSLLDSLESDQQRMQFQPLMQAIVNTIGSMLNEGDEESAQEAMGSLIEIAEDHPTMLRRSLGDVVNAMLMIAEAGNLDDDTRRLAAEFLVTLTEAHDKAPGMMRKLNSQTNFVRKFFALMMDFLLDIEDESEWYTSESDAEDSVSDKYQAAQECLDRIAINLGGKATLEAGSGLIQSYIADADWAKRNAALVAISQIAEGCSKLMLKNLANVATPCLNAFQDPHPRVRWAAVNCVGQLCTDLGPALQKQLHEQILGGLMRVMEDFQNHRVQAHAASALVNFSESCPPRVLAPYMDVLVGKLLQLLQGGTRMVQESTLTALASIADTAQDAFVKYYDSVIPYLKMILREARDKTHRMLRAKAMECTSLIGMAVGRERFMADAREVMDLLLSVQSESKQDSDDMTSSYMLQAWARLCKVLGQEFLPYMDHVMGPLLEAAGSNSAFSVHDSSTADAPAGGDDDDDDDDDVHHIQFGDKVIAIKTSALEEKATACNMLCCYADELKEGFWPYVESSLKILVPLLKYFHEEVRKAAVSAMPELMRSAKLAAEKGMVPDPTTTKKVLDFIIEPLIESVRSEDEKEILSSKLESLGEVCADVGELLSDEQLVEVLKIVDTALRESEERRNELRERTQSADFDEEDREFLTEEKEQEQEICTNAVETVSSLLKKFPEKLQPFLETVFQLLAKYLNANADEADRLIPIGLFSDVIEFANADGVAGGRYIEAFTPILLSCCSPHGDELDLRQTSAFALGVCAQHGGAPFDKFVQDSLAAVGAVCSAPDAKHGDNEMPTDNAVSALGKIAEYRGKLVDRKAVLGVWLKMLPLKGDIDEAKDAHDLLCTMVERGEVALMENGDKLPEIISVFADVLATRAAKESSQLATPEVMTRMVNVLKTLQTSVPAETMSAVWTRMRDEQRQTLQESMAIVA